MLKRDPRPDSQIEFTLADADLRWAWRNELIRLGYSKVAAEQAIHHLRMNNGKNPYASGCRLEKNAPLHADATSRVGALWSAGWPLHHVDFRRLNGLSGSGRPEYNMAAVHALLFFGGLPLTADDVVVISLGLSGRTRSSSQSI